MNTRHSRTFFSLIVIAGFLAACYLAFTVSAETPSAGKTKKAVEAADAATKKAQSAWTAAAGATITAGVNTEYPDNEDGRAATASDGDADAKDAAAEDAAQAAADAREKACRSGNADDAKAADAAEKAAQDAEGKADAADAAADKADRKADPYGKQLQKKKRDARRAFRAAIRAARTAICFALQCAQLMDESSGQNQEKKKETIRTIEGLDSSVDQLALATQPGGGEVKTAQGASTGEGPRATVQTNGGLLVVTFKLPEGLIKLNLPDDVVAGDTISGTVGIEAGGNTPEEKGRSQTVLEGVVIDLEGTKVRANNPHFSWVPPPPINPGAKVRYQLKIVEVLGRQTPYDAMSIAMITPDPTITSPAHPAGAVVTPDPKITPLFIIPPLGQSGRPIVITGPFDGNSSNTKINWTTPRSSVQDFEKNTENVSGGFGLIAESPRKAIVIGPANVTGPIQIQVNDNGSQATGSHRNVGVNLTAPKTNLVRGERTELHVEVNGLQGLKQPVPLTLSYRGVITMEGGPYQPLTIQPSQVSSDGRYSTTRGITGVQTGSWTATATVVTHPFDSCIQDDSNPSIVILWNTVTGDYKFNCPGCPPSAAGGTKTGETTTVAPTGTPGIIFPPPTGLSGTGTMIRKGCIITLTDNRTDRRVMARLDVCTNSGNSTVEVPKTDKKFTITDRNTADNTCGCGPGCK